VLPDTEVMEAPAGSKVARPPPNVDHVDGVTMYWSACDGPLRARLAFRVGEADESLVDHGITHLAEHLALTTLGMPTFQINGAVEDARTCFDVSGSPEEVVAFLAQIASAVHLLPAERLAAEKALLRTEAASRGTWLDDLDRIRFGPRGFGLRGCREFGLEWLTENELHGWTSQRFTSANAVLWLSGPPPAGLRLALPSGARLPPPTPEPRRFGGPAWFGIGDSGMALTALGEPGWPLGAAGRWLQRSLFARLRMQEGVAYKIALDYRPLSHDLAEIVALVDGLPEAAAEAAEGLLDVLADIAASPMPEGELDAWKRESVGSLDEVTSTLALLDRTARRDLFGQADDGDDHEEAIGRVEPAEVQAALSTALETVLLRVPTGVRVGVPHWAPVPTVSDFSISEGDAFAPARHRPEGSRLIVGPDGIMIEPKPGVRRTVRWDRCEAVLSWPDGRRDIVGSDDVVISVHPHDWQDGEALVRAIDARTPPRYRLPMQGPGRVTPPKPLRGLAAVSRGVLVVLTVAYACFAVGVLVAFLRTRSGLALGIEAGLLVATGGLVWALFHRMKAPAAVRGPPQPRTAVSAGVDKALAKASIAQARAWALGGWALCAVALVLGAIAKGVVWPAIFIALFAARATTEWRRRKKRLDDRKAA
jgi:zinc protease